MKAQRHLLQVPLIRWLLFNVAIAVSPLVLNYILRALFQQTPKIIDVIQNGELYLVATALAAASIGEVASKWHRTNDEVGLCMFASFISILVVFISLGCYSALQSFAVIAPKIAQLGNPNISVDKNLLFHTSWIAFLFSVIVGIYATSVETETNAGPDKTKSDGEKQ